MGADNWQEKAIAIIRSEDSGLHIASPRRPIEIDGDFPEDMFTEQIEWEHYYLRQAGVYGAILFWLPREIKHICGRAYAQTTRFELAEAAALNRKIVVGMEEGFPGGKYIRFTLASKYPGIPLCSTLKETCKAAVKLAKNRPP